MATTMSSQVEKGLNFESSKCRRYNVVSKERKNVEFVV